MLIRSTEVPQHKNFHIAINGLTKLIGSCRNNWMFCVVALNYTQYSEKKGIAAAVNSVSILATMKEL